MLAALGPRELEATVLAVPEPREFEATVLAVPEPRELAVLVFNAAEPRCEGGLATLAFEVADWFCALLMEEQGTKGSRGEGSAGRGIRSLFSDFSKYSIRVRRASGLSGWGDACDLIATRLDNFHCNFPVGLGAVLP